MKRQPTTQDNDHSNLTIGLDKNEHQTFGKRMHMYGVHGDALISWSILYFVWCISSFLNCLTLIKGAISYCIITVY